MKGANGVNGGSGVREFNVDVPAGFPPQSRPVVDRFPESEVILSPVTEDDLTDVAAGLYAAFPEWWWAKHEPLELRPSEDVRLARMAKRLSPWVSQPGAHGVKATLASDGRLVGFAGWHGPDRPGFQGFFRRTLNDELGLAERYGWSSEDLEDMWSHVDVASWDGEFGGHDRIRREELGDQPHWYLAPLFVDEEFRGRGIGSKLMRYAIEQADEKDPSVPMYLESFPNARPVYLRYGFQGVKGDDRPLVMIRRGPVEP